MGNCPPCTHKMAEANAVLAATTQHFKDVQSDRNAVTIRSGDSAKEIRRKQATLQELNDKLDKYKTLRGTQKDELQNQTINSKRERARRVASDAADSLGKELTEHTEHVKHLENKQTDLIKGMKNGTLDGGKLAELNKASKILNLAKEKKTKLQKKKDNADLAVVAEQNKLNEINRKHKIKNMSKTDALVAEERNKRIQELHLPDKTTAVLLAKARKREQNNRAEIRKPVEEGSAPIIPGYTSADGAAAAASSGHAASGENEGEFKVAEGKNAGEGGGGGRRTKRNKSRRKRRTRKLKRRRKRNTKRKFRRKIKTKRY